MRYKRQIKWFALNGTWLACGYLGLFRETLWAARVFWFILWVAIPVSALMAVAAVGSKEFKAMLLAHGRSVPAWMDISFDSAVILSLAALGHFCAAAFYIIQMLCLASAFSPPTNKES